MSQSLPTHGFEWVENVEGFTSGKISRLCERSGVGYLLDVDVGYPSDLRYLHNGLPFLPEKLNIDGVKKLVPNPM